MKGACGELYKSPGGANMRHNMRDIVRTIVVLAALAATSCAVTPRHEILPRPDHIRAGVEAGDTVEVETKDGRKLDMVVVEIRGTEIVGERHIVDFADIDRIARRSWTEPNHPCGGGRPVGCSIPEVLLVLSEDLERQSEKFRKACVTHDFCYRHGHATYGENRAACDEVFYADLKASCNTMGPLSILDTREFGICQAAARQTFEAVRRYGEPHFLTTASSYCEYR